MPTGKEEIEELAAQVMAPLVEMAWADDAITAGERQGVLEAAKRLGFDQQSNFCRSTLRRWLHSIPEPEVFSGWRRELAESLAGSETRIARKCERRLIEEARRIAKMDLRPFEEGASLDAQAGITVGEQVVLDDLTKALAPLQREDRDD